MGFSQPSGVFTFGGFLFAGSSLIVALMADMQKQVGADLSELDVIEEMLRPLITAKTIHQSHEGFHHPVTQTKEFQLLGRWLEQRVGQLPKQIVSWIGPEAYQRNFLDFSMLMAVTKIRDLSERLKMAGKTS